MCGIAGLAVYKQAFPSSGIAPALLAMGHRGPDDSGRQRICLQTQGIECELGNRRLAILDLSSRGHQPMHDPLTGNWIAYNGEVFNFKEVGNLLQKSNDEAFESQSDTEVVLKSYAAWGERCLHQLRGMFAFAIWDASDQSLFLARDPLGIKPLYFWRKGGAFAFASEIRALLTIEGIQRGIEPAALINVLRFGSVSEPHTIISGIECLPPGHFLRWRKGEISVHEYWDIPTPYASATPARAKNAEKEQYEELRACLRETMQAHMVSDVPVGVFLSGGIDSSVVAGLLSQEQNCDVHTFSIVFREKEFSEEKYSRLAAQRFGTRHQEVELSSQVFLDNLETCVSVMDQPSLDGINTYTVSQAAHRAGLKVAISGLGGDELFGGYDTFRTIPKLERLVSLVDNAPKIMRRTAASAIRRMRPNSDRTRKIASAIALESGHRHPYFLAREVLPIQHLLRSTDAQALAEADRPLQACLDRVREMDARDRVSYLEMRNYMLNTLLRDADVMSMASSLELRVPFVDHKLIELVFSLSRDLRWRQDAPKSLLVRSVGSLLPDELVHRPKQGFTLPFQAWMKGPFRAPIEDALMSWENTELSDLISPEAVKLVWSGFLAGSVSWSRPWLLYVLHRWVALHGASLRATM